MKESLSTAFAWLIENIGIVAIIVVAVCLVTLITQMVYYGRRYGRIATFRRTRTRRGGEPPAVSVVIPFFDPDFDYLQRVIPKLKAQTHPQFEVIFVNNCPDEEFNLQLSAICDADYRLSVTRMVYNSRFPISTKLALNIGIKAAHYDNIIITTQSCEPASSRWLELMARGFESADIVLGYCGIIPDKGLANRLIRCSELYSSACWLSSAMRGRPYRGTIHNLGLKRTLYFQSGGFNHLSLNMGEDDLYVMSISTPQNTTVVAGPSSIMRRRAWGGLGWRQSERARLSRTHSHYPFRLRLALAGEWWVRGIFFAAALYLIIASPLYGKLAGAFLLLLRWVIVLFQTRRLGRRLSEHHIVGAYLLYDLLSPLYELQLPIYSLISRKKERWK